MHSLKGMQKSDTKQVMFIVIYGFTYQGLHLGHNENYWLGYKNV